MADDGTVFICLLLLAFVLLPCCNAGQDFITEDGYVKIKSALFSFMVVFFITVFALIIAIMRYLRPSCKDGVGETITGGSDNKSGKVHGEEDQVTTMNNQRWSGLYRFTKEEIERAIDYANTRIFLGSGSAGQVYQGMLPSGQLVAIKRIHRTAMSGSFTREADGLSKVRHPNLVCLFGYCDDGAGQYLVYEYCARGNLAQNLLRSDAVLPWAARVKILRDCASVLRFLHTHSDGCIVHRDIKLTNILLTDTMEPKLSDFGLAKMLQMEETKVFTDVRGTIGYMDPEYITHSKLTCASDIYSLGVVVLQLLSGRKVIELDVAARDSLTKKARDVVAGRKPLDEFIDPRVRDEVAIEDFVMILQIAVLCVAHSSVGRPTIRDVYEEMDRAWTNTTARNGVNKVKHVASSVSRPATTTTTAVQFAQV